MDVFDMRREYSSGTLDEASAPPQPVDLFTTWFTQATDAQVLDASAMTLATVSEGGRVSTRIVLCKEFDESGVVFFTNYDSRKGRELAAHAQAALQFHWRELDRVVRVEGRVEKVEEAISDEYFASRPLGSRLGAWASPQSEPIASREVLERREKEAAERFGENPPRPENWGGFRLVPDYWEFWQGRESRLHDRLRYLPSVDGWQRDRLAP